MKILKEVPIQLLVKIREAGMDPDVRYTVFTYGDILYNPGGGDIPDDLMVHEETHTKQQSAFPDEWWDKYLTDKSFRLEQETEAYANQYDYYCSKHKDYYKQQKFVERLASDLSSSLYGNLCNINQAIFLIKTFNLK